LTTKSTSKFTTGRSVKLELPVDLPDSESWTHKAGDIKKLEAFDVMRYEFVSNITLLPAVDVDFVVKKDHGT